MAELVDASDSKSGFRKKVQVRFLFWAQEKARNLVAGFFFVPFLAFSQAGDLLPMLQARNAIAHKPTPQSRQAYALFYYWTYSDSVRRHFISAFFYSLIITFKPY